MKSYRDLEIYVESKRLALIIHEVSYTLPKSELYEEGSQVRRSSKSITSMIVEGYGRKRYKADFIKHLVIAHAECDETMVHLDFLYETGGLKDKVKYQHLKTGYENLSKKLYKFIQWVECNL